MVAIKRGGSRPRNSSSGLGRSAWLLTLPWLSLEIRSPVLFKYLQVRGGKGRVGVCMEAGVVAYVEGGGAALSGGSQAIHTKAVSTPCGESMTSHLQGPL